MENLKAIVPYLLSSLIIIVIAIAVIRVLNGVIDSMIRREERQESPNTTQLNFMKNSVRVIIYTIAIIMISSSPKRQRLGDLTANTTVIKSKQDMQFQLGDILKISSMDNYEPQFPQVKRLSEPDMLLIKGAIFRYQKYRNQAHQKVIIDLVTHLQEVLDIHKKPKNKVEFLKTLIRDYIVLTR